MMFSKLPVVALAALAAVAGAIPTGDSPSSGTCAESTVQCCQTVTPIDQADPNFIEFLHGVFGVTLGVYANAANGCLPISVLGGNCNQQTVCCENVKNVGLVNVALGCSNIL